jgi:hypothetical protein
LPAFEMQPIQQLAPAAVGEGTENEIAIVI